MLPVAVFGVATITAVLAFNDSLVPFLRWIDSRSGIAQGIAALLAFATCWMAAGVLASQWRSLVRLFEGSHSSQLGSGCHFLVIAPSLERSTTRTADIRSTNATPMSST